MKGCYVLLIELKKNQDIDIGKLGNISFRKGFYIYIGSAMNGLENRIERHLRKDKKFHWHIDYFLEKTKILQIFYKENNKKEECKIAEIFNQNFFSIPNFGCSDCSCKSHLFYGDVNEILEIISNIEMTNYKRMN